ncbi:MAG: CHAT domain-containing protein, partial [Bacteroidetes bacterium]|nr:CHAT domain-containing protein [Bacteroidota bacterium]
SQSFEQASQQFTQQIAIETNADRKACLSYHYGKMCYNHGFTPLAEEIWINAFYQFRKASTIDSLLLHRLIYNSSITQLNDKRYSEAIKNFKLALQYISQPTDQAKCYVKIGTCYEEAGEYALSNYYYLLATKNKQLATTDGIKWLSIAYGQMAVNYSALQEADSTLKYAILQMETAEKLSPEQDSYNKMYSYLSQGNAYETKMEYQKAIELYKNSLTIAKQLDNDNYIFRSLSNIGYTYNQLKDQHQALLYLLKAKQLAILMEDSSQVAATINTIGDIYYSAGDFKTSTTYYLDAFNYLIGSEKHYNYHTIPSITSVKSLDYLSDVFVYVKFISMSLIAESNQKDDNAIMISALQYIHFADSLLFMVNQNTLDNASKFYWREQANELYGYAIEAADHINDQSELFYFIERGKYFVLQELMEENIRLSQLTPQLQNELQTIKEIISTLEIKKALASLNQEDLAHLIALKEKFHSITDSLYHTETITTTFVNTATLGQIQTDFLKNANDLYISYLESTSKTYAFFVSKDSSWLKTVEHTTSYLNTKNDFINSISRPINTSADLNKFIVNSHSLYNQLTTENFTQFSNIIINPSGSLNFIPFDALCTDTSEERLILNDHIVRYTLSPSIELQNSIVVPSTTQTLFVAPITFNDQNISDLVNSQYEVQQIKRIVGGKLLMNNAANKFDFEQNAARFNSIHFATHALAGSAGNNLPWIAFHDSKMYLPEIYNLPLKDKFVVLSACETFKGDVINGEGIMNLVWGIHYAGASSVVATLWNTYDKASAELMQSFYGHLKKGESKDEALRQAKLDYIEKHGMKPDQWAPFIYIGDPSPAHYKKNRRLIIPVLGVIAVMCLLLFVATNLKPNSKD